MTDTSILFQPVTINKTTFSNRIAMAPMTRRFSPNGIPGENVRDYYARRAENNVGLIISEGTHIDRKAAARDGNCPRFHGDDALAGWKAIIDSVHAAGGKMAPQIWHEGMARVAKGSPYPDVPSEGPSGHLADGKMVGHAMTEEDIADTVAAYANAAVNAQKLGFDSVEVHGAHGYLIDNFFWDKLNTRDDRYGGDLPARATFAVEVVKAIRELVGPDFPVIFRWSQWKQQDYDARLATTPDALDAFLKRLVDAGVDAIHASTRRFWVPEFPEVDGEQGLNLAGWCKKLTGLPAISVGSVSLSNDFISTFGGQEAEHASIENLISRMEREEFDMIAVGRALIQDPEWATKVKEGRTDDFEDFDRETLSTLY